MTENTITITLEDVTGPDGLDGAWEAMVRGLVDRAESKFLHSDAGKSFHAVAVAAINEAVQTRIAQRLDAAMNDPIQLTNNYGQPTGEPTTLHEMIGDAVKASMSEPVDVHGKPDRHGKTRLARAIQQVAGNTLRDAVRKEISALQDSAKKAVASEIAAAIARQIKT
jgi:hypothetical protein